MLLPDITRFTMDLPTLIEFAECFIILGASLAHPTWQGEWFCEGESGAAPGTGQPWKSAERLQKLWEWDYY